MDTRIYRPPAGEGGAKAESEDCQMGGTTMKPTMTPTMTEYRIVELNRMFSIEVKKGKEWGDLNLYGVPRFFDSLADARSWVATIKRGVVYHDAEDAPNLAQDERKAETYMTAHGKGFTPDELAWIESRPIRNPNILNP
jgi:hypothetical protein